jgi:hypothetical protein
MATKWKTSFLPSPHENTKGAGRAFSSKVMITPLKNAEKSEKRKPAQEAEMTSETPLFFWSAIGIVAFFFSFIFFKLGKDEH